MRPELGLKNNQLGMPEDYKIPAMQGIADRLEAEENHFGAAGD